jgi:hypothetical protein
MVRTEDLAWRNISQEYFKMEYRSTLLSNAITQRQDRLLDSIEDLEAVNKNSNRGPEVISCKCLEETSDILKATIAARRGLKPQIDVLRSLYFADMTFRYQNITYAHRETFAYMFTNHFSKWLQENARFFWLSGKPGSGKSTLMKYLLDDERTIRLLQKWADNRKVVKTSHFFWINGPRISRTLEGLFRMILFNIFCQDPDLIPTAFDDETMMQCDMQWSLQKLTSLLHRLTSRTANTHVFVLFIDGLDEYSGDHRDVVIALQALFSLGNMKLCLASRPWNVFESAFGNNEIHKLYLQDLNKVDIEIYVRNTLQARSDYQLLQREMPAANDLAAEIVNKSNGVFLWTYLVVRSLIEGLENEDRMVDLQRRLQYFPSDLDAFFNYILQSLDPFYKKEVGRGFRAVLVSRTLISMVNFWYMDIEEERPGVILRSIEKGELPLELKWNQVNLQKMKTRINARFKGLIEVRNPAPGVQAGDYAYKVDLLHRTVRDYLFTSDAQQVLGEWMPSEFQIHKILCRTTLAEIWSARHNELVMKSMHARIDDIMFSARECEIINQTPQIKVLDLVELMIKEQWGSMQAFACNSPQSWTFYGSPTFLRFLIQWALYYYVAEYLMRWKVEVDHTLVVEAINLKRLSNDNFTREHEIAIVRTLCALLHASHAPISDFVFYEFVSEIGKLDEREFQRQSRLNFEIIKQLCKHAAILPSHLQELRNEIESLFSRAEYLELNDSLEAAHAWRPSSRNKRAESGDKCGSGKRLRTK